MVLPTPVFHFYFLLMCSIFLQCGKFFWIRCQRTISPLVSPASYFPSIVSGALDPHSFYMRIRTQERKFCGKEQKKCQKTSTGTGTNCNFIEKIK